MNYRDPYFTLQSILARMAADIERYRGKGRVRELADRADALVRQLAPPAIPPTFGDGSFSTGCAVPAYVPRNVDSRAAENACNDLAEELKRTRPQVEGGKKGARTRSDQFAEDRAALRRRWERVRQSVDSDVEADKVTAGINVWEKTGHEAIKQCRLDDERRLLERGEGRWRRPPSARSKKMKAGTARRGKTS